MHAVARLLVGVMEVVGGMLGLALIGASAIDRNALPWIDCAFAAAFVMMVVAGLALLRKHRLGRPLSMTVQAIQLPWIGAGALTYQLAAAVGLWVVISENGVHLEDAVGSMWRVELGSPAGGTSPLPLGVNLVAAICLAMLLTMTQHQRKVLKKAKRG